MLGGYDGVGTRPLVSRENTKVEGRVPMRGFMSLR